MSTRIQGLHMEWETIPARTAKCDLCKAKNNGGMQRCKECKIQACEACFRVLPNNGAHERGKLRPIKQSTSVPESMIPSTTMSAQVTDLMSASRTEGEVQATGGERCSERNESLVVINIGLDDTCHEVFRNEQDCVKDTDALEEAKKRKRYEHAVDGQGEKSRKVKTVKEGKQPAVVTKRNTRIHQIQQSADLFLYVASCGTLPEESFTNLTLDERACFLRKEFAAMYDTSDSETEAELNGQA